MLWEKAINKFKLSNKITLVLYLTNKKISSTRIMYSNKPLVPTTDNMAKEGIINKEIDKPQASKCKKYKSVSNESPVI